MNNKKIQYDWTKITMLVLLIILITIAIFAPLVTTKIVVMVLITVAMIYLSTRGK